MTEEKPSFTVKQFKIIIQDLSYALKNNTRTIPEIKEIYKTLTKEIRADHLYYKFKMPLRLDDLKESKEKKPKDYVNLKMNLLDLAILYGSAEFLNKVFSIAKENLNNKQLEKYINTSKLCKRPIEIFVRIIFKENFLSNPKVTPSYIIKLNIFLDFCVNSKVNLIISDTNSESNFLKIKDYGFILIKFLSDQGMLTQSSTEKNTYLEIIKKLSKFGGKKFPDVSNSDNENLKDSLFSVYVDEDLKIPTPRTSVSSALRISANQITL